jgi:hypothetical protein
MISDFNWVLSTLSQATEGLINVWEILIRFQPGGSLETSSKNAENSLIAEGSCKFLMIHSFSMGIDARIGYHFEQG